MSNCSGRAERRNLANRGVDPAPHLTFTLDFGIILKVLPVLSESVGSVFQSILVV